MSTFKSLSEKLLGFAKRKIEKNLDEGLLIGGSDHNIVLFTVSRSKGKG
ncbi:hypothetical protein [Corallococcus sp. AS-1-12]|nr:hypothetical protein [Corallococcus sp. AS-1-12]MBZ4331827.1 hypothetical protein [Corallococcus sp. AS-1-12]